MKQLFLKSNLLHIRTNEGEFEVSNPEAANQFTIDDGNKFIFGLKSVEWPYGVDLIDMLQIRVGNEWKNLLYQKEYKGNMESTRTIKLARLLPPEEEKKDDIQPKRWEESTSIPSESDYKEEFKPAQPTPNFPKGGTTFTESAYKEGEMCPDCGYSIEDARINMDHHLCKNKDFFKTKPVESSEPQEKEPTAYQKRKAIEKRAVWLKYCLDIGWTKDQLDSLEKIWDQHYDEFGNLIKGVSAPSESQEEIFDDLWDDILKWYEEDNPEIDWYTKRHELKKKFTITRNP